MPKKNGLRCSRSPPSVHKLIFEHSSVFRLACLSLLRATHFESACVEPRHFFAAAIFLCSGLEWGRNNQQFLPGGTAGRQRVYFLLVRWSFPSHRWYLLRGMASNGRAS